MLIYGKAGGGKTVVSTSGGKGTVVFDFDEGMLSALTTKDPHQESRKDVEVVPCYPTDDQQCWQRAKAELSKLVAEARSNKEIKLVVFDSLTAMLERAKEYFAYQANPSDPKMHLQLWQFMFDDVKRFIQKARTLPCPVIFIGHAAMLREDPNNEDSRRVIQLLAYGEKEPQKIPGLFDEFYFASAKKVGKETKYTLQTQANLLVEAKSRGNLPDGVHQSEGIKKILKHIRWDYDTRDFIRSQGDASKT